jgi:hypothetical protein
MWDLGLKFCKKSCFCKLLIISSFTPPPPGFYSCKVPSHSRKIPALLLGRYYRKGLLSWQIIQLIQNQLKIKEMKKATKLILMLCLILSGALTYAHGEARMEKEEGDGIPIEVKECTGVSGSDKSGSINPTLSGHVLTVVFNENWGRFLWRFPRLLEPRCNASQCLRQTDCKFTFPMLGIMLSPLRSPTGMCIMVSLQ